MNPVHTSVQMPATATGLTPADPAEMGPYRLVNRLGAGGMGVVYGAQAGDGSLVAVKVIHPEYAADPDFRSRFSREVEMLSRVGGACAVPLLDSDTGGERPWLATPLVRGMTLSAYLRENKGPLQEDLLHGVAVGIAEALAQIHAAGVVHRDLKPANVVMSPEGPRVLDFGIARALDQTALTRTGSVLGSSGWISPAHYRGEPVSTADDIFAWGALVTYAATGRPPFGRGDPSAVAHRVLSEEPDMEGFTGPLADLASRALSKDAAQRPSAMALVIGVMQVANLARPAGPIESPGVAGSAVAASLQATWHGVEVPEEREVTVAPSPRNVSRGRRRAVVSAAAAAVLVVAGVLGASLLSDGGGAPPIAWFGGGGEDSEPVTTVATVGAGVDADGSPPDGTHVVAFRPADGEGKFGVADDATVLCAWSFCQEEGGSIGNGDAGTVPSDPAALTEHVNTGTRTISAEVTYTEQADGTASISEIVEHHETSGTGTPPWEEQ
ncbi:serine/threonine-protein kinase [Nocardiopsis salina]|uniref:serine/threonine-protein kinase n=1 Tax=Nocardiopsis salina TaxID=245836 RepID=UPI00034603CA|nr:serine/threonine-protein kinase [Nocardiopsis salina]